MDEPVPPTDTPQATATKATRVFWGNYLTLQGFVVGCVFLVYACSVFMLLFRPMPMDGQAGTLLTTMMGALTGSVVTIVSYYFGSSKGSSDKDQTLQVLAKSNTEPSK